MKTKRISLLLLAGSSLMFSCSKNDTVSTPVTAGSYTSIEDVFSKLNVQPKIVTIDASTGGSFYGNSGTRYSFPASAFITATGTTVTGSVQVKVCEYLKKGDMLFSKMLPISNGDPLLSGGEIDVSATQNGTPVYLKPHTFFTSNMPQGTTAPTGMQFFAGNPTLDTTQFKTNWVQPAVDSAHYNFVFTVSTDTLGIISDSLRRCNADMFMSSPNYQTFTVTASIPGITITASDKVFGYTLYDNYKSAWPLGFIGSYTTGVFSEEHIPNIPVHFALFTFIGSKFYGGTLGATPTTGNNYTVNLVETDPVTFKTQLNGL